MSQAFFASHRQRGMASALDAFIPRDLFGGALQISLPARLEDVHLYRPIPDNQEVFVDATSDQSVIVELLDLAEETSDAECSAFHFNSLAHDNDAEEQSILEQEPINVPLPAPLEG